MPILLCKNMSVWLTNCRSDKVEKVPDKDVKEYLDLNVQLEEGMTLQQVMWFRNRTIGIWHIEPNDDPDIDEDYEYISITPKYTLDIKNNGVHIIDKAYNDMNIETIEDSIYVFDYMLNKQVLDLEIRIEREIIEYRDAKFYMPADLTLRELFLTISDGIIES